MRTDNQYGTKFLSAALIATAIGAVVISTAADVSYWLEAAKNPLSQFVYAGGAVVFRAATLLFAAVIAIYMRKGHYGKGILASLVLMVFAAISMSSVIGFGSRERMAPTMVATAKLAAELDAKAQTEALSLKLRTDQIAFLREQAKKAPGPQSRQVAYDALGTATFGTVEVKAAPVMEITDPQAEAFHELFPSWSVKSIQLAMTFAWGIALIFGEMVLMGSGVAIWPPKDDPRKQEPVPAAETTAEPEVAAPSNIIHPPQFAARTAPVMEETAPYDDPDPELDAEIDAIMTEDEQVREFWAAQTRPASAARIGCTSMYKTYCGWAGERGMRPASMQKWGRVVTDLGIVRDKKNASAWAYVGRALIGEGDQLLMAA